MGDVLLRVGPGSPGGDSGEGGDSGRILLSSFSC